jgi:hypothetical protein
MWFYLISPKSFNFESLEVVPRAIREEGSVDSSEKSAI